MIKEMKTVLTNDGYVIKDEKAFRDYMAYIYISPLLICLV